MLRLPVGEKIGFVSTWLKVQYLSAVAASRRERAIWTHYSCLLGGPLLQVEGEGLRSDKTYKQLREFLRRMKLQVKSEVLASPCALCLVVCFLIPV